MFKCPICGDVKENIQSLKKHFVYAHRKVDTCPICGVKVRSIRKHCVTKFTHAGCKQHLAFYYLTMSRHKTNSLLRRAKEVAEEIFKVEEPAEKYRCPICGKTFFLHQLKKHFRYEHDTNYCYICDRRVGKLATHCLSRWDDDDHKVLYWLARHPKSIGPFTRNKLKEAEKVVKQKLVVKKEK